jgi:O-antigen/teichoic acid export membrane protein
MDKNKSLTKSSIFYMIYTMLNVIFPFIAGIYVARILLPNSIGQVETSRNIAQYFVILSMLGIPTYGIREISKARNNREELDKVYSELMIINALSTILFSSCYLIVVFSVLDFRNQLSLYLIVGVSIVLNFFNNDWMYEGLEEFRFMSIRNVFFKMVSFLLLVIFVRSQNNFLAYAAITVVGTAGNYLLNIIFSKRYVTFTIHGLNLKRHLKSIFSLMAVNVAIEIYTMVDITMIGYFCQSSDVAIYSYGSKIYKILVQVVNVFTIVLVPRIALYFQENKMEDFNNLITKAFLIIIILSLPMIVGIWFVADFFIPFIYGDEFALSSSVLKALSFMLLISPIGYLLGSRIMLVSGNERKMIIPVGAGAIVNVLGNSILIPLYKGIGAAIASVVSEVVVMIIYLLLSHKYLKLCKKTIFKSLWKIMVSLTLMIIYLLGMSFIHLTIGWVIPVLQVLGGIVVYVCCLLISKEEISCSFAKKAIKGRKLK